MMFNPTVIFQRTHTGRDEIYEKKRGLTQSERLVLIMIDGTTSCQGVRTKLPVLTDDRFSRALTTLQKKELISEVFLPIEGQDGEQVEQTVIDRFIQQDPTDPLTIISFDPEEDFGVFGPPITPAASTAPVGGALHPTPSSAASRGASNGETFATQAPMDEALIRQAETLAEEVRAQRPQYENPIENVRDFSVRPRPQTEQQPVAPSNARPEKLHWGYWLIGIGLAFIVGFIAARLTH